MRIIYPTYYEESVDADYPFESGISRSNGVVTIENDVFVDGRLFPPDGRYDLFISEVEVSEEVTITLSDGVGEVGTGTFNRATPPDYVTFSSGSTHLGILQGAAEGGLGKLAGWPDGAYTFAAGQTRFAATVVVPQPQVGVRSIVLESGAVFTGDVVLVAEKGVQLTAVRRQGSSSSAGLWARAADYLPGVIRLDVVGDPLFLRRACADVASAFERDVVITTIDFDGTLYYPNETGGFLITIAHDSSNRPALRLTPELNGLGVGFVEG